MAINDTIDVRYWASQPAVAATARRAEARIDWADLAKGLSILLVVLMHSTLGVGEAMSATGWTHDIVAFAKPFRMPDFFLVAGMFAAGALNRPLRQFFDGRVVHFAYFYGLWAALTLVVKGAIEHRGDAGAIGADLVSALYEPHSSLWFIYLLPLMFLALRALASAPLAALIGATVLHVAASMFQDGGPYALSSTMTPSFAVDAFSLFFVFFLAGHVFSARIRQLAALAQDHPALASLAVLVWAMVNGAAVFSGVADHPLMSLPLGLAGALVVVVISALLARLPLFAWLGWLGRHSLIVYVAFTIPMAATRLVLIKTGMIADVGLVSAITFSVALLAPLALARLVQDTHLAWLFRRPQWARMARARG